MEKINMKSDVRYVVATMKDGAPQFIYRDFANKKWMLVDDVSKASKSVNRGIAEILMLQYQSENDGKYSRDEYAILKIEVSYKIIDDSGIVIDAEVC